MDQADLCSRFSFIEKYTLWIMFGPLIRRKTTFKCFCVPSSVWFHYEVSLTCENLLFKKFSCRPMFLFFDFTWAEITFYFTIQDCFPQQASEISYFLIKSSLNAILFLISVTMMKTSSITPKKIFSKLFLLTFSLEHFWVIIFSLITLKISYPYPKYTKIFSARLLASVHGKLFYCLCFISL